MIYDIAIIGSGPAAVSAGIYTARYKMKTLVIGRQVGGQVFVSSEIENYPGFTHITGGELTKNFQEHLTASGAELLFDEVTKIEKIGDVFHIECSINGKYEAKQILLTTGSVRRKLGVPGEEEFYGKGVTYCATCDGTFFKGQTVGVVGGGNTAVESALYLADICEKVHLFVRKGALRAEPMMAERLEQKENVVIEWYTEIEEILGSAKLEKVRLKNEEEREITGLFIEVGSLPDVTLAKALGVECDEWDFVKVDGHQKTNVQGVLAAGDNTTASAKFAQIATAIGEGAVAAKTAYDAFQRS